MYDPRTQLQLQLQIVGVAASIAGLIEMAKAKSSSSGSYNRKCMRLHYKLRSVILARTCLEEHVNNQWQGLDHVPSGIHQWVVPFHVNL